MEDKIKLFLEYMKKEKEISMEFDKEDGIDVDSPDYKLDLACVGRVQSFIAYRNIRIEEAWYSKLNTGNKSREVRERLNEYDAERSRRHATALNSLAGFNAFGERFGLPKFYEGELLDAKDIEDYRNIPVRKEETEFFLQFVDALGRVPSIKLQKYFEGAGIEQGKEESNFLRELQSNISKVEDAYGVEKPPLDEEGDITFKDEKNFGMQLD